MDTLPLVEVDTLRGGNSGSSGGGRSDKTNVCGLPQITVVDALPFSCYLESVLIFFNTLFI